MSSKILINAIDHDECRIAKVKDSKLEEFHVESSSREITQGNIYKGVITRIEPSLQAVFVDYGAERHGFLQQHEIHSDYYQDSANGHRSLRQLVKKGQELMVQVTKDPIMKKGAMLTTFISLAGRHLVLMPGTENRGISRKIEDEKERQRLKEIVHSLQLPEGFGAIIRTAGINSTKTQITKDLRYLLRLWKNIKASVMKVETPSLLYKERSLVVRSIRDNLTPDVSEILIDDPEAYKEALDFIKIASPKQTKIVKLYKGDKPIFSKFQLEKQIASIFESRVTLPSGGSIVIEQTEALVSIDVNSGKATQKDSIEKTALQTNLEAAEEIARQLRLRDLGGLVVIDFIDMRDAKNNLKVEKALKEQLKSDKAKTRTGKISRFGLMELSRQRIRPSIEYGSHIQCKCCRGRGVIPSPETLGLAFMRKLSLEALRAKGPQLTGIVPTDVASYLLNKKRREILELESRRNLSITIEASDDLQPGEDRIVSASA